MQLDIMYETANENHDLCPVIEAVKIIGGKWELSVIKNLSETPLRFNQILRNVYGLNSRTLSRVLKNLIVYGIVNREIVSAQPVTIIYSLTDMGMELKPTIEALRVWGEKHIPQIINVPYPSK